MKKNYNIPEQIRLLIIPNQGKFLGICLEFNIIEEHDNPEELRQILMEMSVSHMKAVINNKLDEALLNREADKKYFDIWEKAVVPSNKKRPGLWFSQTPTNYLKNHHFSHGPKELVAC